MVDTFQTCAAGVGQSWRLCGKEAVACRRALGTLLLSKDDAFNEVFVVAVQVIPLKCSSSFEQGVIRMSPGKINLFFA